MEYFGLNCVVFKSYWLFFHLNYEFMKEYIHLGDLITDLLERQHMTKRDLAGRIGVTSGNVTYLTSKPSMDVQMLHQIGVALKYNFFKHFVIDDGQAAVVAVQQNEGRLLEEKERALREAQAKLAEQERALEQVARDFELVKQENGYLKEINSLLKAAAKK